MEIAEYIDALDHDGALLAESAREAGLAAHVPTCPGWRVRDLVRHQAYVRDWARRQAHETAIHRYDAQAAMAAGRPGPAAAFAPAFAAGRPRGRSLPPSVEPLWRR